MNVKKSYDAWSKIYDTNKNRTRDLEAIALRRNLDPFHFQNCLEIGCGTGKNTAWLVTKADAITAIDLSEEMMAVAQLKVNLDKVVFKQADITKDWDFTKEKFDLITFSLVLEHVENLEHIFENVNRRILPGGYVYIGELHPFKQYGGTKARFETEEGLQIVTCFNHHVSEFTQLARRFGFEIADLNEYFDEEEKATIPRILTLLLRKKDPS